MVRFSNGKIASIARRHLCKASLKSVHLAQESSRKEGSHFHRSFLFLQTINTLLLLRAVLVLGRRRVEHDVVLARLQLGEAVTTDLMDESMIERLTNMMVQV
jgi:hypothetical protein